MTTFDYILLALAVVVLVHQVNLLLRAKRDILIHGTPPNRKAVAVILVLVLVLALVRTENLGQTWPVFAIIGVACVAIFAGGCGLGARGMYSSGRYIPFDQAAYYEIDDRGGRYTLRLSRLSRETHMIVAEKDLPEVLEMMENNNIPKYEAYTRNMARKAGQRMEAQQRREKKKK